MVVWGHQTVKWRIKCQIDFDIPLMTESFIDLNLCSFEACNLVWVGLVDGLGLVA